MAMRAMVELLLKHGANASQSEPTGETLLMIAAQVGEPAVVKLLLDHGAAGERPRSAVRPDGADVRQSRGSCRHRLDADCPRCGSECRHEAGRPACMGKAEFTSLDSVSAWASSAAARLRIAGGAIRRPAA